jgi:ABC-type uncharacterized transport system permease subunit
MIFIGTFLGYLFKTEETIMFSSVIIAAFMMIFSNTLLPIETFFGPLKYVARFNPFVVCDSALRKVMLFGYSYPQIMEEIYILAAFAVVFFLLSWLGRRVTKGVL